MRLEMDDKIFHKLKAGKGGLQLICFPYLGGYANTFLQLADELDDAIEVWSASPPGHGGNTLELVTNIQNLTDLYYENLRHIIKPNSIFFGHSMGGIVAYFLAERILLSLKYPAKPVALVLSACGTPSDFETKTYSLLPDDKLIDHLISYDGISSELVNEKSLLEFFVPVYRADFKILESSSKQTCSPIEIPAFFMWGEKDKIAPLESMVQWLRYFKNGIRVIPIENASHMFVHDQPSVVAERLAEVGSLVID